MPEATPVNHEAHARPQPEFDVGFFTINHFSTNKEGFSIENGTSLHRRDRIIDPLKKHEHSSSPLSLTQDQRTDLRQGMADEVLFTLHEDFPEDKKPDVKEYFTNIDQLSKMKKSGSTKATPEYAALLARQEQLRKQLRKPLFHKYKLADGLGLKVGIRNIRRNGDTLTVDTRPVSYPLYAVGADPLDTAETLDLSAVTGNAAVLMTADNKIILQYRSKKNRPYGDMPGASFAGMLDGELVEDPKDPKEIGTLKPITTKTVKDSASKESREEIGLTEKDFSEFRIVGQARDHVREHDEFLLLAKTKLTSAEVAQRAKDAPRSKSTKKLNAKGDFHFEENFIAIDATPEAIATLLTAVQSPLPPTHAAAFVAAGYNLVLEREKSLQAANLWRDQLQAGIRRNYTEMNRKVQDFYKQNPEKLNDNIPGKPKRNPNGYEPYYFPTDQGLPELMEELYNNGLNKRP